MPVITDASWASSYGWLRVKRLQFVPLPGDTREAGLFYTSSNPLIVDTTIDPGAGIIVWNSLVESAITQLAISKTDRDASDQTAALAALKIGDQMFVQDTTDVRFTVEVAQIPTDMGTWYQIDVIYLKHAGNISNNRALNVDLTYFPDTLPAGDDRMEIHMAQEWPWVLYRIFDDVSGAVVPYAKGIFPMADIRQIEVF